MTCLTKARICCLCEPDNSSQVIVIYEGQIVKALSNCIQNLFCNKSTLLEHTLLLHIIVAVVFSECDIFVCSVCTGNWCIFIMFVMCVKH